MADIQRTVEIIFGAIDNTGQGLSSVSNNLNSISDSVSTITGPFSDLADKALKAETAILALGAAFLTIAVNEASKFGEKIEEINSLVNGSPAEYEKLKSSIQDFAANSTSGFDAIGQAMYIATSNLGDTAKAMDVLTVAERGAIVGATDIESATALLTRTMNAYGLVTDNSATNTANAERVMAAMFATVQNGDINMQALSDNLGKVASTASAAGVPIETVGAAVAALTGAGIGADQSMTLLNSVLKELLTPSEDLQGALGGLSVTANGLPAVLDALKASTGGNADKIYELFSSSEAAKGALILVNDSAGKFDATLKAMDSSVTTFNANYKAMAGGVADSNQQLINNATILLQKIGDPLQDSWAATLDGLIAITKGFSVSIDQGSFDPVFDAFNAFGSDLAEVLKKIGENLPAALEQVDFTSLIDSLRDLGVEMGDLFGNIDLTTPEGLANAIQFVVDSFESLTRVVSGIVDVWGPVVQGFLSGIDAFNGLDDSAKKTTGNFLGISQVFESLKGILTSGTDAIDTVGKALTAIAGIQSFSAIASLGTAFAGAGIAALPLVTALTAITIAVGGMAFGITENINAWDEYKSRQDTVADSTAHLADAQSSIKDKLADISQSTGIAVTSMDELNRAVDDGRLVFNEATGAYEAAKSGVRDFDAEVANAAAGGTDFADAVNQIAAGLINTDEKTTKVIASFQTLGEAEQYFKDNLDSLGNANITYANGLFQINEGAKKTTTATNELTKATKETEKANKAGTEEWKRVQDVMLDTQKQTDDFTIAMGELSNKRYEIDVKANVDLKVAEIEADTARITSAFQATADIVAVLAPAISDLWGVFSSTSSRWDQSQIKDAATRMEARLDAELMQKQQLNDAIVSKLQAQTAMLSSGTPLISMDAGSLAPELEMIFDKILKYTQIKATEQGLSMLVGI